MYGQGSLRTKPARAAHKLDAHGGPEMMTWSAEELRRFLERTAEEDDHQVAFGPTKTGAARRLIDLGAGTIAELRTHKAAQSEKRLRWGLAYQSNDLVFCRTDGHPHDVDVVSQRFDAAVKKSGVKRIRFHDLRHTHATIALQPGVPVKVVSERLGHSKASITQDVYQHVIPGMQEDAAARIGAVVDGI